MKSIFDSGLLDDFEDHNFDTFDIFSINLILAPKIPRYTYNVMSIKIPPEKYKIIGKTFLKIFVIKVTLIGRKFISVTTSVLLKLSLGLFISNYFIKRLPLIVFFIKLVEKIPLYASFVKNALKRWFTYSVNVIRSNQFGVNCVVC